MPLSRLGFFASLAALAWIGTATAADVTYRHQLVEGDPNAKVTVIEYASLTCPHCGAFHRDVWPELKKNYVDTGKVQFIFRHFPLDGLAMAGALVSSCAGPNGRKLVDALFKNQETWLTSQQPIEPLKSYAQLAGMTNEDVETCLRNRAMFDELRTDQMAAAEAQNIEMTPSFFVGEEDIQGGPDYKSFAEILDRHLAAAKK